MRHPSALRILVILDNCGPADGLRMRFCLEAIRHAYPRAAVVFLVGEQPYSALEHSRAFDRAIVSRLYEQRSGSLLRLRLKKAVELVKLPFTLGRGYDLVITLGWGTTLLNILGWVVGCRRIGYANKVPALLSSNLGRYDFDGDMVVQNMALLDAAGIHPPGIGAAGTIHTPDDEDAARRLLEEYGLLGSARPVVLHPGSDWACQQWLPERWAELADRLATEYGAAVVFTGLDGERAYIDSIRAQMHAPSVSLAGRTTLPQLEAILAHSGLCVCVDSVIHDLALAADTPAVVLTGPSDWQRTVSGPGAPIIVNKTAADLRRAIQKCKEGHDMHGGCLDYTCPMAGLRDIAVADVLQAVAIQDGYPARRLAESEV